MARVELRLGSLAIEGWSRAGDETWFRVHPPGLAFDVGRGAGALVGARDLFLTHGHLDHALGLPYVLSQRSVHGLDGTRVFCPAAVVDDVRGFVEAAGRMEEVAYRYELAGLAPGERVDVGSGLSVEGFATDHGVASLGYHLVRRRRRLAPGYVGLDRAALLALKAQGVAVEDEVEETWLSYCGDTGAGIFALEPRLFASRVLLLECTFMDPSQRDRGRLYGHLHLEDLAERQAEFRNQALVLHHLSHRHRWSELRRAVDEKLPALAGRVHLLVDPETR